MSKIYSRIIKVVLISYLVINGAIWGLSPVLIDHYLSEFLANKNLQLSEETNIRYNPFISELHISQLEISEIQASENNSLMSIPSGTIEVGLFKLLANRVVIEKLEIDGLQADVDKILTQLELLAQEETSSTQATTSTEPTTPTEPTSPTKATEQAVASSTAEPSTTESSTAKDETGKDAKVEDEDDKSWLSTAVLELPKLSIKNATLLFTLVEDKQSIELNSLVISDLAFSQLQQSASADITLLINKAVFELHAKLKLNEGIGKFEYGVNLTELDLQRFKSALLTPLNAPEASTITAVTSETNTAQPVNASVKTDETNTGQTSTAEANTAQIDAAPITAPINNEFNDITGLLSLQLQQEVVFDDSEISSQVQGIKLQLTDFALMQIGIENRKVAIADLQFKDGAIELSTPHSLLSLLNQTEQTVASLQQGLSLRSNIAFEQTDLVLEQTRAQQTRTEQTSAQQVTTEQSEDKKAEKSDRGNDKITELFKLAKLNIPDISTVIENGENFIQSDLIEFHNVVLVNDKDAELVNNTTGNNQAENNQVDNNKTEHNKAEQAKESEDPKFSPLLEIAKISVADIQITDNGVLVASVDINKVNSAINKQANGSVVQLNALLSPAPKTNETSQGAASDATKNSPAAKANTKVTSTDTKQDKSLEDKTSEQENPFRFYVGKISLSDDLILAVTDRSVSPSYSNHIRVSTFTLEPIDSEKPSVTTKVKVAGAFDQYSRFSINADVEPFKKDKYVKADITVSEFDLSTTTAYVQQFMAIESGHLSTVSNFVINGEHINGNARLNLSRVELTESFDYDSSTMVDSFIPVNVALSMLKDGDGNIELDVPIDGDLNSPDFRLSGFMSLLVQRATMSATKEYLMNAFVPYASIIQIGMQAGEFILKVRFQDLILTTGEDEIPESASEFLNEFSALMLDKEDTQITVCALSTKSDIGIESTQKLTVNQLDKLNQLSLKRMKNFKDLMVDEHKIKSSRLLLCAPRVDNDKGAKPRLTFSN
ncbi:hypothetical protein GCM10008107_00810 [Psychrosphaera saromensis]|uniref:DUF748 domain-containing protein n=1 Tax=Psychrosphaera saromensis TaxID=716813 RepID=A0A2S7UY80_9GAMM|nr:DUF748 domain-containing protein [Psychrosphaera saromensis]PQJ54947.1 hypothetical protein BTO11_15660 [Psychrosphaera saromensis]GHB55910.1 hypothetical protein GCM10008107_00810 [Psychrosphaera saromensis]GLQ13803.1 hypothetical protein GCM10007917_12580 [Psychrosphaera saromensis]